MRCGRSKIALLILATITVPVPTLHSNGEDSDKDTHFAIWQICLEIETNKLGKITFSQAGVFYWLL